MDTGGRARDRRVYSEWLLMEGLGSVGFKATGCWWNGR